MPETKKSESKPNETPLHQKLASHFSELTEKVFKKALKVSELDRFQEVINKISSAILVHAEKTAIVKCKAINDAIKNAFKRIGTDMDELTSRVDDLEDKVAAQHHCLKEWVATGKPPPDE